LCFLNFVARVDFVREEPGDDQCPHSALRGIYNLVSVTHIQSLSVRSFFEFSAFCMWQNHQS